MSIEKLASFPPVTWCQSTPEEVSTRLAPFPNASQTGADEERQNPWGYSAFILEAHPCFLQSAVGILITNGRYTFNETGTVCARIFDLVSFVYLNFKL